MSDVDIAAGQLAPLRGPYRWYAIIHSANSKMPRRMITSDDGPINLEAHIAPGEWGFQVESEDLLREDDGAVSPQKMREMVAKYHGIDHTCIPDDKSIVVDPEQALIVNIVHADPEIDRHHEGELYSWPAAAERNDKFANQELLKRFVVTSETVVVGFLWERPDNLDPSLQGMVIQDVSLAVGDKLDELQMIIPTSPVEI